jgi:hypothetical protein
MNTLAVEVQNVITCLLQPPNISVLVCVNYIQHMLIQPSSTV